MKRQLHAGTLSLVLCGSRILSHLQEYADAIEQPINISQGIMNKKKRSEACSPFRRDDLPKAEQECKYSAGMTYTATA